MSFSENNTQWNFEEKNVRYYVNTLPKPFIIKPIKNDPIPIYISTIITNQHTHTPTRTNTNTNTNTNINTNINTDTYIK